MRMCLHFAVSLVCTLGCAAFASAQEDPIIAFAKERVKAPAKPFTLVVKVTLKEGANDRFESAFAKCLAATRKEAGCIHYDLNRDTDNGRQYVVYERWKTLSDLEAHMKTAHIKTLLEVLPDMLDGRPGLHILLPAGE